jgi:hypothetical protein
MLFESASSGYAVATIGGDLPAISSSYAGYTLQVANSAPYSASWVAVPNVTVTNAVSSSFAATASSADNLTVRGTLTAQTINVQTITSSIEFITGSTRNGSLSTNTHQFTGSVLMSGSLGIGTTSPLTALEVLPSITNSSIKTGGIEIQSYAVNNGWIADNMYYSGSWKTRATGYSTQIYFGQGTISFNRFASTGSGATISPITSMFIDTSGNVGIGTTSPGEKLGVFGNILINTNNTASSGEIDKIVFGKAHTVGGGYAYSMSEIRSFTSNGYAGGLNFYTGRSIGGGAYDAVFAMKINELGNVLVGTSTDNGYKLNVSGSIYGSSFITINGQINNLGTGTGTYTQTVWYNDTGNQILFENARITDSASGTGRTVYFTWRGGPSVGGGVQLQHGANAWAAYTSDARMKTKVADVTDGLETINKLNPIKFKWTRELENSRTVTGFTAQNVGEAIPDAVFDSWHDDELGDVKSYYQDYLVPYLVKSIQELSAKNTQLEEILQRNNIQ